LGFKVLELAINQDHVHPAHISLPNNTSPQDYEIIKGGISNILRGEFPELLKLPSLWTHSHHVSTIGAISKETIEKYIEA
jgi:putative transposase